VVTMPPKKNTSRIKYNPIIPKKDIIPRGIIKENILPVTPVEPKIEDKPPQEEDIPLPNTTVKEPNLPLEISEEKLIPNDQIIPTENNNETETVVPTMIPLIVPTTQKKDTTNTNKKPTGRNKRKGRKYVSVTGETVDTSKIGPRNGGLINPITIPGDDNDDE